MTWYFNNEEYNEVSDPKLVGFVYIITNLKDNRKYVGKKSFFFSKTKQVNKKKKKYKAESDWKTYYGSNDELQKDVEKFGSENFKREIIELCYSKGKCSYIEAKLQFQNEVLESNEWYNGYIMCRIHKSHVK